MSEKNSAKIRALIVDDEPLARSNLNVLLKNDHGIDVVAVCESGADAIESVRRLRPDLIFLDVQMPECDGFDVIELLSSDLPPAVVFVTAYDEYALRAFDAGALDYLLKPFDDARFRLTLARVKERLKQVSSQPKYVQRLTVKDAGQVLFLKTEDIDRVEAADYYACLRVGKTTHLLRRSLSDLGQQLDPQSFCRIHRSTIVNIHRVRAIESDDAGEYEVVVEDGARLKMSRKYKKELEERMSALG